jgi:hypothetical protein
MAVAWKRIAYVDEAILKTVLTTTGDLLHRNEAGAPDRLAIDTDGHVLTIASSLPAWVDVTAAAHHAASHKSSGGDDVIPMNELIAAGNVVFAGYEAKDLVVYNKTSPPATPVLGKWYYDTDTDVGLYICTSIA